MYIKSTLHNIKSTREIYLNDQIVWESENWPQLWQKISWWQWEVTHKWQTDMAVIEENANCDLWEDMRKSTDLPEPERKVFSGMGFRDSESGVCFYYNFTQSST